MAKAKKKTKQIPVSQEDNVQAQPQLEQYHEVASNLRTSRNREQAEAALTEINNRPEGAQIALLKALSKEQHVDAADVLLAINELSPVKSVRKEARRSLIHLEGARIYPRWKLPVPQPFAPVVLKAPDLVSEFVDFDEESEEESPNLHDLSPQEVVTTFLESYVNDDYPTAYNLLAQDSPLREGLSEDEWVERRDSWADAANPDDLEQNFIREREPEQSELELPNPIDTDHSTTHKVIESGWSMELDETPLSDTLPELPKATVIYEETNRHWFWSSYTLVQDEGEWRIQSMTDEGTRAESLSIEELQERIQAYDQYLIEFAEEHNLADPRQLTDEDTQHYLEVILWRFMHSIYYTDALIKKLPLDQSLYERAASRTLLLGQLERCVAYVEPLAHRFTEQRGENLRRLAAVRRRLIKKYFEVGDSERGERCLELAEEALKESLAVEGNLGAHIALAESLIDADRLDEAEDHLLQARAMDTDSSNEAHIEMHLGEIAMGREQYAEALRHCQRVAELEPEQINTWLGLAKVHEKLGQFEEAEANYRRAIELEPDNEDLYFALSKMYSEHNQPAKAIEAIEDGLSTNPESAVLNIYLATMYMEQGDYRQAELILERVERLDPDVPFVSMFRDLLKLEKQNPLFSKSKPGKSETSGR